MDDKALYVSYIGKEGEELQIVDKLPCLFLAALYLKCEDGCSAVGEVPLIEGVIRMIGKRRMIYMLNLGVLHKVVYDLLRVLIVALNSQGQSLYALDEEKSVER